MPPLSLASALRSSALTTASRASRLLNGLIVVFMKKYSVVADGAPAAVRANAQVQAVYLGEAP